jgi:xanthine phosphoribosyltransferase
MVEKEFYSYEKFTHDVEVLTTVLAPYAPDMILGIARGGMTLAHFLSYRLNVRNVATLQAKLYEGHIRYEGVSVGDIPELSHYKKVLIVDEIVDSGKTMAKIKDILAWRYPEIEFRSVVLYQKPTAIVKADFFLHEADVWVDFFWEGEQQ